MNIPLDRLYHFIKKYAEELWGDNVIIYRFWPDGAKNLANIKPLTTNDWPNWKEGQLRPSIYCHDQEPLNWTYYQNVSRYTIEKLPCYDNDFGRTLLEQFPDYMPPNIRLFSNIYDKTILLHSEKRSKNLEQYESDQFVGVYYWSHALIARDWFRYAQVCPKQKKKTDKTFLLYNRAWSGTREYRLKLSEMLIQQNLVDSCKMTINPIEPELGIHYEQHVFTNPLWRPLVELENYWPTKNVPSHYSADFDIEDYETTDIEIVLETLFDDERLHLTEKILRPIACGQPFIACGTHGTLQYLRDYGFKTFDQIWNEDYDNIQDPHDRMIAIVNTMKTIDAWSEQEKIEKIAKAKEIADHNQHLFFSEQFTNGIFNELRENLKHAMSKINQNTGHAYCSRWQNLLENQAILDVM